MSYVRKERYPRVFTPSEERRQELMSKANLYNPVQVIRDAMKLEDFNAYELYEETGIHYNTIYNWTKNGKQPSHANFMAALNAMGYSLKLVRTKD
jgi:hypothetical protein